MSKKSSVIQVRQQNYTSLRAAFRSESGAIDLASIMVGIIVIGLIGGVIAATVFAIIPWTQDNAAKQQLDSIHSAQNAFYGLSSDPTANLTGGVVNSFTGSQGLETAKLLTASTTYCAIPTAAGKDYTAYAKSASGKIWTATNSSKKATILSGTPAGACSSLGGSTGGTTTPAAANGGVVTTYSTADWSGLRGLAVAADGTVYASHVTGTTNIIKKMTSGGTMVTLAGNGTAGFADGQGSAAQFNSPQGVALGPDGNLYVTDWSNNRIRMVTPTGLVSTVAGNGSAGALNGDKSVATFDGPKGIAFDGAGNMYITESTGHRVRKITSAGVVSTLATLPTDIYALAADASGNVYVGGNGGNTITKVTPAGAMSVLTTSTSYYRGLVVEESTGIIYATNLNTIEKILPDGTRTVLAGTSSQAGNVNGTGAAARFATPWSIQIDSTGALIVGSNSTADTTLRMIK